MTDNCPKCPRLAVESIATRSDGVQRTDRYRCPACGHTWVTRRHLRSYEGYDPAAADDQGAA